MRCKQLYWLVFPLRGAVQLREMPRRKKPRHRVRHVGKSTCCCQRPPSTRKWESEQCSSSRRPPDGWSRQGQGQILVKEGETYYGEDGEAMCCPVEVMTFTSNKSNDFVATLTSRCMRDSTACIPCWLTVKSSTMAVRCLSLATMSKTSLSGGCIKLLSLYLFYATKESVMCRLSANGVSRQPVSYIDQCFNGLSWTLATHPYSALGEKAIGVECGAPIMGVSMAVTRTIQMGTTAYLWQNFITKSRPQRAS